MLTVGSLFAGIGGFDKGLEETGGFITKWQVEIDPYCNRVLAKHWPAVPRYGDITAVDWATVEPVDVLCGGFPCQDLSFAGKRAGIDGARSGLWGEYVRAIRALRPHYVIVENVPGLLTNEYMGRVLGDLAESGYDAEWDCIPASAVGAPHRRDRVWIVCVQTEGWRCPADESFTGSRGEIGDNATISYPLTVGQQKQREPLAHDTRGELGRLRTEHSARWPSEPAIQRVVDGFPGRVDRLRGLGNAIVPQIAEALGRMILRAEEQA